MHRSQILKTLLLFAIVLGLVGCSATPTTRSFDEGWNDNLISAKVKLKMTRDEYLKKSNYNVDVWRGVVTLTGRCTSVEERERAEEVAKKVNGVRGVDNFLQLVGSATANEDVEIVAAESKRGKIVKEEVAVKPVEKKAAKVATTPKTDVTAPKTAKVAPKVTEPDVADAADIAPAATPAVTPAPVVPKRIAPKVDSSVAKRTSYDKPSSSQIEGQDLTAEEDFLAKEAAEELRKLRGEEDLSE